MHLHGAAVAFRCMCLQPPCPHLILGAESMWGSGVWTMGTKLPVGVIFGNHSKTVVLLNILKLTRCASNTPGAIHFPNPRGLGSGVQTGGEGGGFQNFSGLRGIFELPVSF